MTHQDVLIGLRHAAKCMYENGYNSTLDCIEETIVEIERLRDTVICMKSENEHLRSMNMKMLRTISELMPLEKLLIPLGDAGQNPVGMPTKPADQLTASGAADPQGESK